ncbi:hypothetical protein DFO70_13120 [Cytobacillus firmus]|uniref:Lipoprotein n=2 Tax=Cytobacillus TaxID=2675230 RepID=A0A366JI59_CYTFI|nr:MULTISPECIES: CueP family metal-binding protein [Cytobacillus]RBP86187.1 hypothetical protein DFO70_13120 [Cytobacillus firmus]TDX36400.1 hypothetical protein DFO72_12017 [Cytobacillus oceanisediminis]
MKTKIFVIIGLVAITLLTACSSDNDSSAPDEKGTENIKELVHEYSLGKIGNHTASITDRQLIVKDSDRDEGQKTYALPDDEFFVSIAPYVDETHQCTVHNWPGCQGEMVEEQFEVYIEDMDGNVVVDESLTSQENGFIDFWLPSDKTYHVTISHNGKMVDAEISTSQGEATCITTMQLS